MESPPPQENSPMIDRRRKAVGVLNKGQEAFLQLQSLLQKNPIEHGSDSAESLAKKVELSFSNALSILNSSSGEADEDRPNPSHTQLCSRDHQSKKIPVVKDRRGSYKRRNTSETWIIVTATPLDDGRSWRKYGQKEILGAAFPRSYFRCTHKNDQGCPATKQVQQMEGDSTQYRVTYMGHHTCRDPLKASQLILGSTTTREPNIINFESNSASNNQDYNPWILSPFSSIKQEMNEEMRSDLTQISSPSSGYNLMPSDLTTFSSGGPLTTFSMAGSDTGEVASGMHSCVSSPTLDMDLTFGSVELEDVFCFDQGNLFDRSL